MSTFRNTLLIIKMENMTKLMLIACALRTLFSTSYADAPPMPTEEPSFTGFIDLVTIDAHTSGIHNGIPAFFKDEIFNLTVNIHLNETWLDIAGEAELTVNITIPNENHVVGEVCSNTLIGGTEFDCTTSTEIRYNYYFNLYEFDIFFEIADNVHVEPGYPVIHPLDHGSVSIDFGNVFLRPLMTTTMSPTASYTSGIPWTENFTLPVYMDLILLSSSIEYLMGAKYGSIKI